MLLAFWQVWVLGFHALEPLCSQYGGTRSVKDGYTLDVNNKIGEGAYGQVFTGVCKETNEKVRAAQRPAPHPSHSAQP